MARDVCFAIKDDIQALQTLTAYHCDHYPPPKTFPHSEYHHGSTFISTASTIESLYGNLFITNNILTVIFRNLPNSK